MPDTAEGKLGPLIGVMRALILVRPSWWPEPGPLAASGGVPVTAPARPRLSPGHQCRRGWVGEKKEQLRCLLRSLCAVLCVACDAGTQRSSVTSGDTREGHSTIFLSTCLCSEAYPRLTHFGLRPSLLYIAVADAWVFSLCIRGCFPYKCIGVCIASVSCLYPCVSKRIRVYRGQLDTLRYALIQCRYMRIQNQHL